MRPRFDGSKMFGRTFWAGPASAVSTKRVYWSEIRLGACAASPIAMTATTAAAQAPMRTGSSRGSDAPGARRPPGRGEGGDPRVESVEHEPEEGGACHAGCEHHGDAM